jgi:hypothetical protein
VTHPIFVAFGDLSAQSDAVLEQMSNVLMKEVEYGSGDTFPDRLDRTEALAMLALERVRRLELNAGG